jgi:hypothetical protein
LQLAASVSVQFICWEAASDKVYQLLGHGRWFSPDTPASSTTKTGRHDIAEILLKVALSTINQIKSFAGNNQVLIYGYERIKVYDCASCTIELSSNSV